MKLAPAVIAAGIALALAGCSKKADQALAPSAPVAAVAPPAGKQWAEVVTVTPDGGYQMGNPNAAVKLVEYGSYTCPHCKAFAIEGEPKLKADYVASGKVSYEFRSFLLHGPDAAVTLLANCRGAEPFFAVAEALFASQDDWLNKLIAVPAAEQERWQSLAPVDSFKAQIAASGLKSFLAARGLAPAQADACLADEKAADVLVKQRDHATNDLQVNGTPAFFINGQQQENVFDWASLEPRLKSAIG